MLAFFFFFLSAGCFWLSRRIYQSWVSPLALLGGGWNLALGLYLARWIYFDEVQTTTLLMLIGSFLFFVCGAMVPAATRALPGGRALSTAQIDQARRRTLSLVDERKLLWVIAVCFALGATASAIAFAHVIREFGILFYFRAEGAAVESFTRDVFPGFGTLYTLVTMVPSLCVLYWIKGGKRKRLVAAIFVFSVVCSLVSYRKIYFIKALFFAGLVGLEYRWLSMKKVAVAGTVTVLLFTGIMIGKSPYYLDGLDYDYIDYRAAGYSRVPAGPLSLLTPIYLYFTAPMAGFNVYWRDGLAAEETLSAATLQPVHHVILKMGIHDHLPGLEIPFYEVPVITNVATYLGAFWMDYGFWGTILAPFLIGLAGTSFFCALQRFPYSVYYLCYLPLAWCCFISYFSNHFIYYDNYFLSLAYLVITFLIVPTFGAAYRSARRQT